MNTKIQQSCSLLISLGLVVNLNACHQGAHDPRTPAQRLSAVNQVAAADDSELSVHPLRNTENDDLRRNARSKRDAGDLVGSASLLDQALQVVSADPETLQERAEVSLLQGQWNQAEQFAEHAIKLGSTAGPLCRRHWATIEQSRLALHQDALAAQAHTSIAQCTVPKLP